MTIISSERKNEIQFFRNNLPWIMKNDSPKSMIQPPCYRLILSKAVKSFVLHGRTLDD